MDQHQFRVNLGTVTFSWTPQGKLTRIEWSWDQHAAVSTFAIPPGIANLVRKFQAYFNTGELLGEVPWELLDPSGWSPFQAQVYRAIAQIPHGETRTYGWVAARVGNGYASRAVGQALRSNPLPILVPCHRVVAVTSLGGFMGTIDPNCSELRLKQRLIALEEEYINPLFDFLTPSRELNEPLHSRGLNEPLHSRGPQGLPEPEPILEAALG